MKTNELFLTILDEEYSRWYYQALRIVGQPEVAKEVLQFCACKLGRAPLASIHPSGLRPYIARTVENAARDFRKAGWLGCRRMGHLTRPHELVDPRATPLEALLEREEQEDRDQLIAMALKLLERLPAEQARAVRFMYLSAEPPTLTDFAKAEGIPITTARSRVIAGLSKLRQALAHALPAGAAAQPAT